MSKKNSAQFFSLLKGNKILFNKSQIPSIRDAKEKAWEELRQSYLKKFGVETTISQLKKKIQNMRTDVKKKTDLRATGNKPINLKEWEQELLELMEENNNPVFNRVHGCMDVSFGMERDRAVISGELFTPAKKIKLEIGDGATGSNKKRKPEIGDGAIGSNRKIKKETIEAGTDPSAPVHINKKIEEVANRTKNLSIQELQRLVLTKQLALCELKLNKFKENENNNQNIIIESNSDVEVVEELTEEPHSGDEFIDI